MKSFFLYSTLLSSVSCAPWPLFRSSQQTRVVKRASAAPPRATPLSLPASEYWDGDDGPWSTFQFQVGTPAQQIRLLPGTSTSTLYFIDPQGCSATDNDSSSCPQARGGTFNPNGSSTWSPLGTFQYEGAYSQSSLLGYTASAEYGDDSVTLAWPGSNGPTLQNQIVGGIIEKAIWYVGNFGISPRALNITSLANSHPTPMQNLRSQNLIPSTTWAYTAGFHDNQYPVFGSVTLGGYDTTRFRPNGISFPFGNDISRDILVSVQYINSAAATAAGSLLPNPINAYIDSTVPAIWLPLEACQAFEKAFNLTYNTDVNYYLLTDDQHQNLLNLNPTITFTLGSGLAGGNTVDIVLPYKAFDLNLTTPIADNPQPYFPLQRAENQTQYVLGRTFLQHAYVIADYDRSNFSVSQALFPQQDVQPNIVPIYPPGTGANGESLAPTKSSSISGGAIAGIVVGVVAALVLLAAAIFAWRKHTATKAATASAAAATPVAGQMPGYGHEPGAASPQREMATYEGLPAYEKAELDVTRDEAGTPMTERSPGSPLSAGAYKAGTTELSAEGRDIHEAPPEGAKEKRGELDSTPALKRHEMDAGQTVAEMDGEEGVYKKEGKGGGAGGARSGGAGGRGSGPVFEMEG